MSFVDASDTALRFVAESTWGSTPTSPTLKAVRFASESLNYNIDNVTSDEIRSDRQLADLIQVGAGMAGDVGFELSYDAHLQDLMAAALGGSWTSNVLKAGTVKSSFTFQKKFEAGATDQFFIFTGARINTMGLQIRAKEIIKGSFGLIGKGATLQQSAIAGASDSSAGSGAVMAAPDLASIVIGGVSTPLAVMDLSFQVTNNLRPQPAVGQIDLAGIGYGRFEVSGNLNAYFEDDDLVEEFIAGNASSLAFTISDGTSDYDILVPRVKFETGQVVAGGNNQDVMQNLTWRGLYDTSEATALKITRVP